MGKKKAKKKERKKKSRRQTTKDNRSGRTETHGNNTDTMSGKMSTRRSAEQTDGTTTAAGRSPRTIQELGGARITPSKEDCQMH